MPRTETVKHIGRMLAWFDIRGIVRQSAGVLVSAVVSLIFGLMPAFSPMLRMSVGVFVILLTGFLKCGRLHKNEAGFLKWETGFSRN